MVEAEGKFILQTLVVRTRLTGYVVAALVVLVALSVKLAFSSVLGSANPFLLFFAAVVFAAWYGGFGPGILATMLAAICGANYFMPTLTRQSWFDHLRLGVFVLEGVLISRLSALLQTTERRAATSVGEASQYREISRQQAQTFRQLVENVHNHAVFMMDETGRINSWNLGVERVFGYREAEILGQPFTQLFTSEDAASEQDRGFVVRSKRERPVRVIGSMMDISERKHAERERLALLARADAEKANQVKNEFVMMVSHELRTPLTTIKTMTRLLRRETRSEAERREPLDAISIECDRQIDLVLNLLDLTRIDSGRLHLSLEPVAPEEMMMACFKIEQKAATLRQQELILDLPAKVLPAVRADHKELRRVLCMLAETAIKYAQDGGRITLRATAGDDALELSATVNVDAISIHTDSSRRSQTDKVVSHSKRRRKWTK